MRILLAQLTPIPGDVEANVGRLAGALAESVHVDLAVFPELYLSGYQPSVAPRLALQVADPAISRIRDLARTRRTALIVGFIEDRGNRAYANAALCIDSDGSIAGIHRKTHLFGSAERRAFLPGGQLELLRLAGWKVGPLICFEVEFPEPARALARAGAELIVTLAANMHPYGQCHDLAARARALENRRPHVYVNRTGSEAGFDFVGGSQLIDGEGRTVVSSGAVETLMVADLPRTELDPDLDYLALARPELTVVSP